jgi:hypothetical protein
MEMNGRSFLTALSLVILALACQVSTSQGLSGHDRAFKPSAVIAVPLSGTARTVRNADASVQECPNGGDGSIDSTSVSAPPPAEPPARYFYEPFPLEPGSSILQIGGSFSLLPYPDAEQEVPIPALDVQYKLGVFKNFAAVGVLSTCYFSNLVHAGIQWNTDIHRFSCGVANHVGFVYGFITRENLFDDVEGFGLFDMMIVRLGFRFDDFACSCSFVTTYIMDSKSYVNGLRAPGGPERSLNDYYCTLVVEQPFLSNLRLSIGLSLGYARTPYQTWMLYSTVDEWLFSPEFFFAVQL